ncbi:hypothetical protein [Cronobacter sakazakii]|uniref:hypothetical protein n=1 Tax=Cronobacter sakazakii TaxID=28141 RepID=UPI000A119179|nr:hypothetical protein [Cronobacter sakazakii]
MSFTDTSSAKKYASIAETAAAQAKLYANKLELAPNYAEQAATSATAAAASAQVAVNAEGVVNNLVVSASESATSAAESAALAGNAAAAAVGQCVRVVEGELIDPLPESSTRANSFLVFDSTGNATVLSKDDVAILDPEGKIPVSMIPAIAITQPFVVSSQAAMLALDAQVGDVAKRTDKGFSFILSAEPASTLSNWVQLNDDVLAQLGLSSGAAQVGALDDAGGSTTVQRALNLKATTASLTSTDAANRAWTNENFVDSTYKKLQTGNFATGFTITSQFQVVLYPTDGFWYRYLGTLSGGGLTLPAGSSPDSSWENINKQQMVSLRKLNELSTQSIAGYIGVNIDMPVSVKDSDNQGARVGSGVTIRNDIPTQNAVKTAKVQSAFRLDGDDTTFINVAGNGLADNTNTATSEFITSRMADQVDGRKLKRLTVSGADITGFTTGIALSGINGAIINDVRARNMRYSPTGLNSAGGYLLVCGGNAKHVIANNIQHTLVEQADRHTLYISAASGDTLGWSYWNVSNIDSDYSANSVNNRFPGTNPSFPTGVPHAMTPIHVRNGQNMNLNNHMVEGYSCSAIDYENQFGGIHNTNVNNVMSTDAQSYQNGTMVDQGVLRLGGNQYGFVNKHHNFNNIVVKIIRGTDNSGNKMAPGTDNGIWGTHLQFVNFNNVVSTTESGYAVKLYDSKYVNIQNLADELIDGASGLNSVYLNNCSYITLGNIQSNRAPTVNFERVYTIEDNCSEITCMFPRRVLLLVNAGAVSVVEDRWKMLGGSPAISGPNISVPLKNHVSTNAKRTARIENLTAANITAIRVDDIDSNTLRFGLWDNSTNASASIASASNTVSISFSS